MNTGSRILKIGIFYDGNYFYHVSNYYCYAHPRRSRLSIPGLHAFIKSLVAEKEGLPERFCQIVDCHYFRGRLPAKEAYARQILLNERIFDDILMREGVVTHYLPTSGGAEKGVDCHHTMEDLGLVLGDALNQAVGDKAGIRRYGNFLLPMDEALAMIALDLSGRPYLVYDVKVPAPYIKDLDTALFHEFFMAFAVKSAMNLHIRMISGAEVHHVFEAIFKGIARALAEAVSIDPRVKGIPSTKGSLA